MKDVKEAQAVTPMATAAQIKKCAPVSSPAATAAVAPDGSLLSVLWVPPEQFFAERHSALERTGAHRLLVAVLQDAVACWFRYRHAQRTRERRLFQEISAWFAADQRDWLFDFERICDHLGLEPDYIRQGLTQWRSVESGRTAPRFPVVSVVNKRGRLNA